MLQQLTPARAPWADATGPAITFVDIRVNQRLRLHTSSRPMTISITCGCFWGTLPLLLFSDPQMVHPVDVNQFQGQAVHRLHQQHIQLGFRKGMTVLVYYRVQSAPHVNEVFQDCPHCTRVCCESRKENGKQAVETGCPIRDRVCMAAPQHCMGLLQ